MFEKLATWVASTPLATTTLGFSQSQHAQDNKENHNSTHLSLKKNKKNNIQLAWMFHKNLSYEIILSDLSHRIIDSFARILKWKRIEKTSFVRPKGPKVRTTKTGNNFMIFIFLFKENCDAMHEFPGNGSNPADINWFRSHTRNSIIPYIKVIGCLKGGGDLF